jgi:parvulin-like peptidyl-prolyl isomerase
MKIIPLSTLILLNILIIVHSLAAKEKELPFLINGKPVPQVVARVNGVALTSEILQRELFTFRFQSKKIGKEIKPKEEYSIARKLLQSIVARELIVQKATSLGITISDKKIELQLKNIEDQFPNNKLFITALAFQHMNIASLKEKIHRTLLEDELIRREIAPKVKVIDESIRNFYDENLTRFTKPVLYRLRHIHISTLSPTVEAEGKLNKEKAARLIRLINEEAKQKIDSLLKKVQSGEDFIMLAKSFSEDQATKEEGGLLGELHPDSTIPEISKEMIKLKEHDTSRVIQSQFGYHILKLDEIIPSKLIPFTETKSDILNLLLKRKTRKLFTTYVEELGNNANIDVLL